MRRIAAIAGIAAATALAGCGSDSKEAAAPAAKQPPGFAAAQNVEGADFRPAEGLTLQQIADQTNAGPQVGLASSEFVPGTNRLAFGLIGEDNAFVYGPSAVYIARSPGAKAQGPFVAPLDSMQVSPAFVSRNSAADGGDAKGIYAANVPLPKPGRYAVLVVTSLGGQQIGSPTQITVKRSSPIPAVGERPPAIDTPTKASVAGNIEEIDTRVPPDDMHEVSFKDALGKRPVALLFSTPALCQSRVCGPVTDIALELEKTYGKRMTFIHQEIYVDNELDKGLRPQLKAFGLQTEPWLFVAGADGRIAARLEGAFGHAAFKRAIEAGLS